MTEISQYETVYANNTPTMTGTATLFTSASVGTGASVVVKTANTNRLGLYIYNNGANTVYIFFGATANSSTSMTLPIATFTTWAMPVPIYTGQISAIRNSGSGMLLITELTA